MILHLQQYDVPESTILCLDENGKLLSSKKAVYVKMPYPAKVNERREDLYQAKFLTNNEQCWFISEGAVEHTEFISESCDTSGSSSSIILPASLHTNASQCQDEHLIFLTEEQLRKDEVYVITEAGDSVTLEMLRTSENVDEMTGCSGTSGIIPVKASLEKKSKSGMSACLVKDQKKSTIFRSFKCEICAKAFSSNYSLGCHMRTHTKETPYHCSAEGCCKKFKMSGDLAKHFRSHTGERPFVCDVCGRGFSTCNNLKVHMRTHTGERPYACTEPNCGKKFSSDTNFKNHMRIHRGEKPYVCSVPDCGKRFTEYSSLFKHRVVHEDQRKFTCHLCLRQYRQVCTLRHHLRSVHHIQSCNNCGTCVQCGKNNNNACDIKNITISKNSNSEIVTEITPGEPAPQEQRFFLEAVEYWPDAGDDGAGVAEQPILLLASDALLSDQEVTTSLLSPVLHDSHSL
ncbi:zinc finger protein 143 isoform X2 [Hyalella azteca]|uniref:Zinc finger protein 143 isoform X2 n=1 Tax=Hyalella azteca TaxID=294128 RepID=A0A8B7NSB3_HYAAZ|nr:zinc finger protein 143 isoform X2 [Hyalella azteca]